MKSITLLKQISEVTLSAEGLNEEGCCGNGSNSTWLIHVRTPSDEWEFTCEREKQRSNIWSSVRVCWAQQGCAVQPRNMHRGVRNQDVSAGMTANVRDLTPLTLLMPCFSTCPWMTLSAVPRGCSSMFTVAESSEEHWLLWDDLQGKVLIICFYCWLQGELWVLSDTQVLAAPGELHAHKCTLCARILVFHLKLFAWLHEDGETMVNPRPTHRHTVFILLVFQISWVFQTM